jgi:hypothetical protein
MKNNTKKNLLAAFALPLLLFACDKNSALPEPELPAKEVSVRIHSLQIEAGSKEDRPRADSQKEATATSLIGNGLLMEMSLAEDPAPPRTAQELQLSTGSHFRVIAVKTGTTEYVSHGDFTVGSGANTDASFLVPENTTYDFICYSYNSSSTLPAFSHQRGDNISSETLGGSMPNLLWSKQTLSVINTDPALIITLKHVTARLKVIIDCSYNDWKITAINHTNIKLASVATTGSINLATGSITSSPTSLAVTWPGTLVSNSSQQPSNILYVMEKAESELTISIPASVISRQSLTAIPAAASTGKITTELDRGKSYNLHVRLRRPVWAGSNIYWDGNATTGKLTFSTEGDKTKEGYQGVFFIWGSLVGVSPALVGTAYQILNAPVYIPQYNTTTPTASTWTTSIHSAITIPYIAGTTNETAERYDTYLMDPAQNTPAMYESKKGDICQYLGTIDATLKGYRMPMSIEFGTINSGNSVSKDGWSTGGKFTDAHSIVDAYGRTDLLSANNNRGYAKNTLMDNNPNGIRFPASGFRPINGMLSCVGTEGYYWTGSNKTRVGIVSRYGLQFYEGVIYPFELHNDKAYHSVRCIKK